MFLPTPVLEFLREGIFGLFLTAALGQLVYYLVLFGRLTYYKRIPQLKKFPISVIICARNEAENLRKNLPAVLSQKHENFEVVVVNDCSSDDTDEVLDALKKKYPHLRTTSIVPDSKFTHGKKLALTIGIKASTHEWLVFTDADCRPVSDQWLNRLQDNFTDKNQLVLGYGAYETRKGLLNKYLQFDTLMIAVQYLSYAIAGIPYMGVGRNLAYRKSLFYKNKGFASHYGLLSGDDDLFVNETATRENTAVEFHPDSHTLSIPELSWKAWFTQKCRHMSTSGRYKPKHIFLLGLEPLLRLVFYFTFCYLIVLKIHIVPTVSIFGIRLISQLLIMKLSMRRLSVSGILFLVPVFDLFSLFINLYTHLANRFRRKPKRWK